MKFCSKCGREVVQRVPEGDHLPRFVCEACGTIHYVNPRMVVGCIAEHEGRILLARRAIEPRKGLWTLPAGFMESGETTEQGAARETREEARADTVELVPFSLINVPHISQVHLLFRARLKDGRHGPTAESQETALMQEADIPWDRIAFPSMHYTLERYLEDRRKGTFGFHITTWTRHHD